MLRVLLICSLIPLILLAIISYKHYFDKTQDNAISAIEAVNNQLSININNRMNQVEALSEVISYYVYDLYNSPIEELTNYLEVYSTFRADIESVSNANRLLKIILFLPPNKMLSEHGNRIDILPFNDLVKFDMSVDEALNSKSLSFWKFNNNQKFAPALTSQTFDVLGFWNISRNLKDSSLNYAYVVLIDTAEFSNYLNNNSPYSGKSFLLDENEIVIASYRAEDIGMKFDFPYETVHPKFINVLQTTAELCVITKVNDLNYSIYSIIDRELMKNEGKTLSVYIITAAICICAFAAVFSLTISYRITDRINRMSKVIRTTQGSQNREILTEIDDLRNKPDELKDEIDQLADTYCTMLLKNDEINKQYIKMIDQKNSLKYQLLQAEINPHFLFNSLNSVCDCIISGDNNSAIDMIKKMAEFYRILLKTSEDLISIEQELHITELYLQMMCYCKRTRIRWLFEIEEGIEKFLICKFVLQPLVENTILHGISYDMDDLIIKIKMQYEEDSILISISDNGKGIREDELSYLLKKINNDDEISKNNYGLINVDRRLRPYYTVNQHIHIQSTLDKGTTCSFYLKQLYGE